MRSYKKLKLFRVCIMAMLITSLCMTGCYVNHSDAQITTDPQDSTIEATSESTDAPTEAPTEEPTEPPTEPEPIIYTASIGAMGDLLMHRPIFNNKPVKQSDGTYNFESIFQHISDYTSALDYTVANLETTLCGKGNGYAYNGYPNFNCPDEIVYAMKNAGFDMLLTANNHSYDTSLVGYKRTLDVVRSAGLETLGTYSSADETKWTIVDVNGINIGMLCYTWAYDVTQDGRPSLNGNAHIAEFGLCNYFYSDNLTAFYEEVEGYVAEMEAAGTDATMMFIHWGEEYKISPSEEQKEIAQKLCDMDIDVIVGGHPHVIQPIELLESTVNPEHKTVCIYSTGNAVSNQRQGSLDLIQTAHTEDGILFSVTFEKVDDGETYVKDIDVLPTWVYMDKSGGKREYNIIPLKIDDVERWKEEFGLDETNFQKAQDSYNRTMEIVGEGLENVREYLAGPRGVG